MTLHINQLAPDFTQQSTLGEINLYSYLGNQWGGSFFAPERFYSCMHNRTCRSCKIAK